MIQGSMHAQMYKFAIVYIVSFVTTLSNHHADAVATGTAGVSNSYLVSL